jgi:hypothetical protein
MTKTIPPETVALVRRRYVEGASNAQIKAETGIKSTWLLYRCIDGKLDDGLGAPLPLPALPRRRDNLTRPESRKGAGAVPASPQERLTLAERIHAAAEREIAAVEQILNVLGDTDKSETENAARTLASVARTLRELVQLDVPPESADPTHDKPVPRDLAELRRSLARKLEALVAGDVGPLPGQP